MMTVATGGSVDRSDYRSSAGNVANCESTDAGSIIAGITRNCTAAIDIQRKV
jgi:hypothetical protein